MEDHVSSAGGGERVVPILRTAHTTRLSCSHLDTRGRHWREAGPDDKRSSREGPWGASEDFREGRDMVRFAFGKASSSSNKERALEGNTAAGRGQGGG